VFSPSRDEYRDIVDRLTAARPDTEGWDASRQAQVYWPRVFAPSAARLGRDAGGHRPGRLVRGLYLLYLAVPVIGVVGWLAAVAYLQRVAGGPVSGLVWPGMMCFILALVYLATVVLELVMRRLSLACAIAARPFPVTLATNLVFAFVFVVAGAVLLWAAVSGSP